MTPQALIVGRAGGRPTSELLTLENTAIVLDSTCDPPDGCFDQPGLYMVPLKVHFGDQMFRDGVDMTYKEFFAKLEPSDVLPTTSQPTAGEFVAAYEEARRHYEHVFSLHISGEMSGTVRAARAGGRAVRQRVRLRHCAPSRRALSLVRRAPARPPRRRAARSTRRTPTCEHFRDHSQLLVHAATLEYLRRGGRIGRAASLVGGVFDIKPLIARRRRHARPATPRCAGSKKALAAMQRFVEERSRPDDELYFCLIDADERRGAAAHPRDDRAGAAQRRTSPSRATSAAVVGTHIGPGTAAFAMIVE